MKSYKIDPEIEKCLPPLDEDRYQWIKKEIQTKGYNDAFPIIIWEDHDIIVDGHHRYKICRELGIEPLVSEQKFESLDDAILFAIDHQENRRNLSETQKATLVVTRRLIQERIAARNRYLAGTPAPNGRGGTNIGRASDIMARDAKVGPRTIQRVMTVVDKGAPELQDMMLKGDLSSRAAEDFVRKVPIKEQNTIIKDGGVDAVKEKVTAMRDTKLHEQKQREQKIEAEVEEYKNVLKEQFGNSKYACGVSQWHELWCNDCKCAFDVCKPCIGKRCPACGHENIVARDESWYPGKRC